MVQLGSYVHLDLVGHEGEGPYARLVHELICRRGLSERVRTHGPLHGEALAERYAAADAFALPSRSESFGIVYAEAMSTGLPVIACRVGPVPWLVEEECGFLVTLGDTAALAGAMEKLVADPVLRTRMGQAALRRAQRLPTWQESGDKFCNLVRSMLPGDARGDL